MAHYMKGQETSNLFETFYLDVPLLRKLCFYSFNIVGQKSRLMIKKLKKLCEFSTSTKVRYGTVNTDSDLGLTYMPSSLKQRKEAVKSLGHLKKRS